MTQVVGFSVVFITLAVNFGRASSVELPVVSSSWTSSNASACTANACELVAQLERKTIDLHRRVLSLEQPGIPDFFSVVGFWIPVLIKLSYFCSLENKQ